MVFVGFNFWDSTGKYGVIRNPVRYGGTEWIYGSQTQRTHCFGLSLRLYETETGLYNAQGNFRSFRTNKAARWHMWILPRSRVLRTYSVFQLCTKNEYPSSFFSFPSPSPPTPPRKERFVSESTLGELDTKRNIAATRFILQQPPSIQTWN